MSKCYDKQITSKWEVKWGEVQLKKNEKKKSEWCWSNCNKTHWNTDFSHSFHLPPTQLKASFVNGNANCCIFQLIKSSCLSPSNLSSMYYVETEKMSGGVEREFYVCKMLTLINTFQWMKTLKTVKSWMKCNSICKWIGKINVL